MQSVSLQALTHHPSEGTGDLIIIELIHLPNEADA
jgi:hypothetical protein